MVPYALLKHISGLKFTGTLFFDQISFTFQLTCNEKYYPKTRPKVEILHAPVNIPFDEESLETLRKWKGETSRLIDVVRELYTKVEALLSPKPRGKFKI